MFRSLSSEIKDCVPDLIRVRFDIKDACLIHDPVLLIACGNVVEDGLILLQHVAACRMQMTEHVVPYTMLLDCLCE